jgi:cytochrome bd-type quinol oxidase subunit 2
MKSPIAAAAAIAIGLLVLAGILLQPLLDNILTVLLHLAVLLASVALMVGIVNLISVHWLRVRHKEHRSVYSFVVIAAFLITLLAGILINPNTPDFDRVITNIQYPIEASLMGLTVVSFAFSSLTLIKRQKHSLFVYLFLCSTLFFILIMIGLFDRINSPILQMMVNLLESIPIGGIRGLLIGMALGSLITGIRIITGTDRPYAG